MNPVKALSADCDLLCVVGAGGKKTTLYTLASRIERAVLTATVRIPIIDQEVESVVLTDNPGSEIKRHNAGADGWPVGLVRERNGDRYLGFDPAAVSDLTNTHNGSVLVKGDGARTREFKAPGADEPRIPDATDVVVPIVSMHAVGRPLTEKYVHRPEQVVALTDLHYGDTITPDAIATVIVHPSGGLKNVPPNTVIVPLLNKVDSPADERVAREIGRKILHRIHHAPPMQCPDGVLIPRVVLARMIDPTVVAVLE